MLTERQVLELMRDVVNEADQHVTLRRGLRATLDRRLAALPSAAQAEHESDCPAAQAWDIPEALAACRCAQADGEEPTLGRLSTNAIETCISFLSVNGDNDLVRAARAEVEALRARPAPSSSPCPDCESKDAFIDALQKRIDSLLSGTVESFVDGVLTIRPHKEVVAVMAEALASVLDEAEAPNYVEMELKRAGSTKAYRLTIQRPEGRSAHELRMEAERKLAELKASPSPAPSHALVEAVSSVLEHDCPVCFDQDPASQAAMKRWINLGDEYRSARSSLPAAKKDGGA